MKLVYGNPLNPDPPKLAILPAVPGIFNLGITTSSYKNINVYNYWNPAKLIFL